MKQTKQAKLQQVSEHEILMGRRAVLEACESGATIKKAWILKQQPQEKALDRIVQRLGALDVSMQYVSKQDLDMRSGNGAHQGVVAQLAPFSYTPLKEVLARIEGQKNALIVVLDHLTDQRNFGAIARSAEIVGASAIVVANARAARVGLGAYKTSAGALLYLPVIQVPNIAQCLQELKKHDFWVAGASEHATQDAWQSPLKGRLALVMGSEDQGISQLVRKQCDFLCKLPQVGKIESLNVAQAATVLCYEWLRRTSTDV